MTLHQLLGDERRAVFEAIAVAAWDASQAADEEAARFLGALANGSRKLGFMHTEAQLIDNGRMIVSGLEIEPAE